MIVSKEAGAAVEHCQHLSDVLSPAFALYICHPGMPLLLRWVLLRIFGGGWSIHWLSSSATLGSLRSRNGRNLISHERRNVRKQLAEKGSRARRAR